MNQKIDNHKILFVTTSMNMILLLKNKKSLNPKNVV